MSSQVGKRYECNVCGGQLICTRAGGGVLECDGTPMALVEPRVLPSSD
jgi:hypothetical protein